MSGIAVSFRKFTRKKPFFVALNIFLILTIVLLISYQEEPVYSDSLEVNQSLEDPNHGMNIRYNPDGPVRSYLRPNRSVWVDYGADGYRIPPYKVETNSVGARDDELSEESEDPRVVYIGDSFTFGWGVNKTDRYTEVAEENLERDIDSVNMGVPGTGIKDYYNILTEKALETDPDTVIVGFRYSDVRSERESAEFREEAEKELPEDIEDREQEINDMLIEIHSEFKDQQEFNNSPLEKYMIKIAEKAEQEDTNLIFYLLDERGNEQYVDDYKELAHRYNFDFIGASDKIKQNPIEDLIIREGDVHFNQKGHQIMGEKLAEGLENKSLD